ncbi:MAG: TIM barrel protein, partial [Halocynthiibacter sp.]
MHTISAEQIEKANAPKRAELARDFANLGELLARRGHDIDVLKTRIAGFGVAIPSWGVGTGGTRFARFPGPGEPRGIFDKLDDCAVIQALTRATPSVSLHYPWDRGDAGEIRDRATTHGLDFDAVNSNTFQDHAGQTHSYKFGSLSHSDAATRAQAIDHNIACIEFGAALGSKALTVWVGDGSNFPGQSHFTRQFERYLTSLKDIYAHLPADWALYTEHKMYEPAFYSTVVQDWGTNYLIATELGDQAKCLVDLGHHAPNVNIEMIVARLLQFGKLGGFHFNDSKYGDDDLDAGSIDPYRLFLIFNELVEAERLPGGGPALAHMLDQSHNITDPIESLMTS